MTSAPHDLYDCVIIGGGPAGLTAAVYLARYRRRIVLFDGGESRAALISLKVIVIQAFRRASQERVCLRRKATVTSWIVAPPETALRGLSFTEAGLARAQRATGDVGSPIRNRVYPDVAFSVPA